jgi:hypothetical protein
MSCPVMCVDTGCNGLIVVVIGVVAALLYTRDYV